MAFSAGLAIVSNRQANKAAEVSATEGYTTYYNNDVGIYTYPESRIVNGTVEQDGVNYRYFAGNKRLADKCELKLRFKYNTTNTFFISVGGYAVFFSQGSSAKFNYATIKKYDNAAWSIDSRSNNLLLKTEDGVTDLYTAAGNNKYFKTYMDATFRLDLSNYAAPSVEFEVEYQGVTYFPFDGENRVYSYDYIVSSVQKNPTNFVGDEQHSFFCGNQVTENSDNQIIQLMDNDLSTMITPFTPTTNQGERSFDPSYIGDYHVIFTLSSQIFSSNYINDHLNAFLDRSGNPIDVASGILINGKTLRYWVNYNDPLFVQSGSSTGAHEFPLQAETVHNPVSVRIGSTKIEFRINTAVIPMDSVVITFKAGVFKGYYSNLYYELHEDLTFFSTLKDSELGKYNRNVLMKKAVNETVSQYSITSVVPWSDQTAAGGKQYKKWVVLTNIPKAAGINETFPHDHYRYMFDNILINGKSLTYFNVWGRANSKDYIGDEFNINYETEHPGGMVDNKLYNMVTYMQLSDDGANGNYKFVIDVPFQLIEDFPDILGTGSFTFTIRDSSAWYTPDGTVRAAVSPTDKYEVENFIDANMHMSEFVGNNNDTNACRSEGAGAQGYYLTAKQALNELTADQVEYFAENAVDAEIVAARARFEAWAVANNDGAPYDGNNSIVTPASAAVIPAIISDSDNNNVLIIVVAMSVFSVLVLGAYFFLKRKQ